VVPTAIDATTGELAIPDDPSIVGWYQYGPSPGEPGSAVLAGHLDWHHKPGAFYRLDRIAPGTVITIRYTDGSSRRFQVVENALVPKPSLPVSDVFVRTGPPMLRLVTCGGTFDRATHHYRSNVVVTAVPLAA
jgi:sortase (surface protein transpeptidase)